MSSKVHEYRGKSITVRYDAKRCIHAAECVHGLPGVFDPKAKPWIDPDGAPADELASVVLRCPTGALQYERLDGGAEETAPGENTITVEADGPLYLSGDIEVVDSDGAVVVREARVALCRCGASEHKPFCDGKHAEAEFRDSGAIPDPRLKAGDASEGEVKIALARNGPLVLTGPVTLKGGEDNCTGDRGALCRCGASENKPFCDGAHARIGFVG